MSGSDPDRPVARETVPPGGAAAAEPIRAIRLKHPGRIVVAIVLVLLLALFIIDAAGREAYGWGNFAKYVFDRRISQAALNTLLLTIYSMAIAIVLGIVLSVMRLSGNPVVKGVAWLYLWIFRGTPVYVQLAFWGLFATIYSTIDIGIPFTAPWLSFETKNVIDVFWLAVIGLALNEAAYMAEIVRAGILSVDKGQEEAATALGMGWLLTMRRIVLPQAMRVIIPPTGNEVISMLKTTSLVAAVPFSFDLYGRARDISVEIFDPVPLLLVASAWYLLFTSILMTGQYFLERRFSRGVGQARTTRRADAVGATATGRGSLPAAGTTATPGADTTEGDGR